MSFWLRNLFILIVHLLLDRFWMIRMRTMRYVWRIRSWWRYWVNARRGLGSGVQWALLLWVRHWMIGILAVWSFVERRFARPWVSIGLEWLVFIDWWGWVITTYIVPVILVPWIAWLILRIVIGFQPFLSTFVFIDIFLRLGVWTLFLLFFLPIVSWLLF